MLGSAGGPRARCRSLDARHVPDRERRHAVATSRSAPMIAAHRESRRRGHAGGGAESARRITTTASCSTTTIVSPGSFRRGGRRQLALRRRPGRPTRRCSRRSPTASPRRRSPASIASAWRTGRALFAAWRVTTPFLDVGTPRDYLEAARQLAGSRGDLLLIEAGRRGRSDGTRRRDTVVWPVRAHWRRRRRSRAAS